MDESEIARTALRIYQQHRRALDVIFEHRPDNLRLVSEAVRKLLAENASRLGIVMESFSKSYLRFTPSEWIQPGNSHGNAWTGSNRTILIEMGFSDKVSILITSGLAPAAWIDPLWQQAASLPFRRPNRTKRPKDWCSLHGTGSSKLPLHLDDLIDPAEVALKVFNHCVRWYQSNETQEVIKIVKQEIPKLETILMGSNVR